MKNRLTNLLLTLGLTTALGVGGCTVVLEKNPYGPSLNNATVPGHVEFPYGSDSYILTTLYREINPAWGEACQQDFTNRWGYFEFRNVSPEDNRHFIAADLIDPFGIWWTDQTGWFYVHYNETTYPKNLYLRPVWPSKTTENEPYLEEVADIINDAKDGEIDYNRLERLREIKEEIK